MQSLDNEFQVLGYKWLFTKFALGNIMKVPQN